jgi:hypothetical protein
MHFGENQLSPGSISISPLSTRHPPVLQHWWVRASTRSYPRFTLRMDSSPGFGSGVGNADCFALFRLAFASAPRLYRRLTSGGGAPQGPPRCRHQLVGSFYKRHAIRPETLRKALRVPSDCLLALGFSVSFIPLPGCFSPFPHGTRSLSVAKQYCALEGGPPSFPQDCSCPVVLWSKRHAHHRPSHTGLSPSTALFPTSFCWTMVTHVRTLTAAALTATPLVWLAPASRFGLIPFRSPLLRESRLIPLPHGTEMFQFPRFPSHPYAFKVRYHPMTGGGLPHSGSDGSSLACSSPSTFRRSPRPSSALGP